MPSVESAVQVLKGGIDKLPLKSRDFAKSILAAVESPRGASQKQFYWIEKLAEQIKAEKAQPEIQTSKNVGNFDGVIELFERAKEHLQFPKIRLQLKDKTAFTLSLAGQNAKLPGTVNVVTGKYPYTVFYGRVFPDGRWLPNSKIEAKITASVVSILAALAKNPAKVAAEYGKLTGNCCFCSRPLSDERSTDVGYGKICAEKWQLPWG